MVPNNAYVPQYNTSYEQEYTAPQQIAQFPSVPTVEPVHPQQKLRDTDMLIEI